MICGPIQIGDSQRQLVKKTKTKTNSSRSICLHFPDLFIYLFIYSFVSLSWRYKPPQPELPRIPSLTCTVRTASPKRQERRYFNLEPGDADHLSRFVKGRLFCRQFALSVHVIKILLVKTLLSVLLPMINWIRMPLSKDKLHSCAVRCYNLKHVVRGVDR